MGWHVNYAKSLKGRKETIGKVCWMYSFQGNEDILKSARQKASLMAYFFRIYTLRAGIYNEFFFKGDCKSMSLL